MGLTNKKRAALDKILKREETTFPTKPNGKVKAIEKPKKDILKGRVAKQRSGAAKFDLWNKNLDAVVDEIEDDDARRRFMDTVRLRRVKAPKTLHVKPSALRAVAIPDAGASYNPDVNSYKDMVDRLVEKEKKVMKHEDREERAAKLPEGMSMVTYEEREREMLAGLGVLPDEKEEEDGEGTTIIASTTVTTKTAEESAKAAAPANKPKTKKQRRKEKERKAEEVLRRRKKERVKAEHSIYRSKRLLREVREEAAAHEKELKERRAEKAVMNATRRKKLGRGKFEEREEDFLLPEELPGSIRALKPQGCIVTERLQSLQRRNMLPIGGESNKRRLKDKLKVKHMEMRDTKEIKLGTKLRY